MPEQTPPIMTQEELDNLLAGDDIEKSTMKRLIECVQSLQMPMRLLPVTIV